MNMGSSIYNPDILTKDLQRQQFIERAKSLLNRSKYTNEDCKMPLFQAAVSSTICERPSPSPFENRYPMTGKPGNYDGSYTDQWLESNASIQSAREAALTEKIRKIEDQLGLTSAQIRESQASKQFLKAKLKLLEEKVQQKMTVREPVESLEVQQLNQLTAYAKETLDRLKTLRGLQMQERCMKESYKQVEKMGLDSNCPLIPGSSGYNSNLSLTNH